jgi:hypothetical protein
VAEALGPRTARAAVLPLDAERWASRVICVDHLPHDDATLEVLALTLSAHVRSASPMRALVLGTRRASALGWPTADDWWRYGAAVERCSAAGVELLDWIVVGDHGAVSLAELDGRPEARWAPG